MTELRKEALFLTPEQYLEYEEGSDVRHEYIDGYVEAMSGGSWAHRVISTNILGLLHAQLRGQACVPYGQDARVRIRLPKRTFYYYPDVTVDCSGARELETEEPAVIFEVLSDSTRRACVGEKLIHYLNLPSLHAYVLVEQDQPKVTIHRRVEGETWIAETLTKRDDLLRLPAIGCTLPLKEIYDRLDF